MEDEAMLSFAPRPRAAKSNFTSTPCFEKNVLIQQMLSSSRKSLQTQITARTQSGSPHSQSFGSAVRIHKEAPGNGFLMGSWQDWWADRRYVKYLLFWLLLELWPYLKQVPNEGHLEGDYSPAALHELRVGIKAKRKSVKRCLRLTRNRVKRQRQRKLIWRRRDIKSHLRTEQHDELHHGGAWLHTNKTCVDKPHQCK